MREGHIVSDYSATLYTDGAVDTIGYTHPNFERASRALKNGAYDAARELMKPIRMIKKLGQGFSVEGNTVMFQGDAVNNLVCDRIIDAVGQNQNVQHLVNFLAKLRNNPSYNSQHELYKFLEVNNLPISDSGDFIAYKLINTDWTDGFTGKIDNSVGAHPTMNRVDVDDDSSKTCSRGLHVCGFEYLTGWHGGRLIAVAVNPRDVVSVPHDYNGSKMRCCGYKVIEELNKDLISSGRDILTEDKRYHDPCAEASEEAYEEGYQEGRDSGYNDGYEEGKEAGADENW